MDVAEIIHPGMMREETFLVEDSNTAITVGSGGSRVLATPWMIAFMERASHWLLSEHIPASHSSVGVLVNVRHIAPSPVGSSIRVRTLVENVDGYKVSFHVEAWDRHEQIGEGTHMRVVIDKERFLRRVDAKIPDEDVDT